MTNADWCARVVQARTQRDDLRPQRLWTLHKGEASGPRSCSPSTARVDCNGHLHSYAIRRDGSEYDHQQRKRFRFQLRVRHGDLSLTPTRGLHAELPRLMSLRLRY